LLAGLPKFAEGAWVPILVATVISIMAITWLTGRRAVARGLAAGQESVEDFLKEYGNLDHEPKGTVVFLTGDPTGVPFVANHRWLGPLIAEEQLVLMTIAPVPIPYVADDTRVTMERFSSRFVRVKAKFGYMERPTLVPILRQCKRVALDIDKETTSFLYASPVIVRNDHDGLPAWQRGLFVWLQNNSRTLAADLEIPANRRVALSVDAAV
jgi:KUP system potassium uptake protein